MAIALAVVIGGGASWLLRGDTGISTAAPDATEPTAVTAPPLDATTTTATVPPPAAPDGFDAGFASHGAIEPFGSGAIVANELLILTELDADQAAVFNAVTTAVADQGGEVVGSVAELGMIQARFPDSDVEALLAIATELAALPSVEYAVLHGTASSTALPDDYDPGAWDEPGPSAVWHHTAIASPAAWNLSTGSTGVEVGVIDVGIDAAHPDLAANIDSLLSYAEAWPDATTDHGTHVAATACGVGNNDRGIAGIAWDCALTAIDLGGDGKDIPVADITLAMLNAANTRVVNMSLSWEPEWGCGNGAFDAATDVVPDDAVLLEQTTPVWRRGYEAANQRADDAGSSVLWVNSAGNHCVPTAVTLPGLLAPEFDNLLLVAATDVDGYLWSSPTSGSNYGPDVHVAAPGANIWSAADPDLCRNCESFGLDGTYGYKTGTSMAAPQVTGVAALMLAANPNLTAAEIASCLVDSARTTGIPPLVRPEHPAIADQITDLWTLDAPRAVTCALGGSPYSPTFDELLSARIPAMCGHAPTQLVNGEDVDVGPNDGEFLLRTELDDGNPSWVALPNTADGALTAVVARCNAGGVGWPDPIMFFGAGPVFYDDTFLSDFDWEPYGLSAPARGGITRIASDESRLIVELGMYAEGEGGCCWSGSAVVALEARNGEAVVTDVLAYDTGQGTVVPPTDPTAQTACGARTLRAWMETERFDIAICGEPGATSYVGLNRDTGNGIELAACALNDFVWIATNEGYEYQVDIWVDGVPELRVYDPSGDLIVLEPARSLNGELRYDYGLGPGGIYCDS